MSGRATFWNGADALSRFAVTSFVLLIMVLAAPSRVLAQSGSAASVEAEQVRAHAREILSHSEFQPESPDSPTAQLGRAFRERWDNGARWMEQRWSSLRRWLDRTFRFAGPATGAVGSAFSYAFAAIFIALAGWIIAWLIRTIWINRRAKQARARTAYSETEDDDGILPEPNAWMQQAATYADSADYRRAFRAVFVAMLLLLDEAGLVEYDRARTNGDYLRLLRRRSLEPYVEIFEPLVLEFDRRWYGSAETDLEDYVRIQERFEAVRTLMASPISGQAPAAAAGKV